MLLLIPVCPLPSLAVIVMLDPEPVKVTDPVHAPFDQPLVPVLVGLIVKPPETVRPTELPYPVIMFPYESSAVTVMLKEDPEV